MSCRASLFARRFLHQPSIDVGDSKRKNSSPSLPSTTSFSPQLRFQNASKIDLLRSPSKYSVSHRFGASSYRSLSAANRDSGHSGIADFLSENAVETTDSSAPAAVVNEVAASAGDSFIPASLVQCLIHAVYFCAGFKWWASIVIVTLTSRGVLLLFSVLKKLQTGEGVDAEHMKEYIETLKEALTVALIKASVHVPFYLKISITAGKVPSFKAGGSFWFLDLSTPDSLYILPLLTALSICIPAKAENMVAVWGTRKVGYVRMILALLSLPVTVSLPKAVLVYWLAHAIFDRVFNIVEFLWFGEEWPLLNKRGS